MRGGLVLLLLFSGMVARAEVAPRTELTPVAPAGEKADVPETPSAADQEAALRRKLRRSITFEFADTPLNEALAFFRQTTQVNLVLSPKVDAERAITLRVQDMDAGNALEWILRLAEAESEIKGNSIFVKESKDAIAAREAAEKKQREAEEREERLQAAAALANQNTADHMRVNLQNGQAIELHGQLARDEGPGVLQKVADLLNPVPPIPEGADGVLIVRPVVDFPQVMNLTFAQGLVLKAAPGVQIENAGEVWIISAKDPAVMRRAMVAIRFLREQKTPLRGGTERPEGVEGPPGPIEEQKF